jgi:hypothetical protein
LPHLWRTISAAAVVLGLLAACSSLDQVDMSEPKRVLGRDENVRIDAQLFANAVGSNSMVRINYEITNERDEAIAIADLDPFASYDRESRTITIEIGSEVPGNELLPRLVRIAAGERRSMTGLARMPVVSVVKAPFAEPPRLIRLRMHFLDAVGPFEQLIGIPERAIRNPILADELFPQWIESTSTVSTNSIPIQWSGPDSSPVSSPGPGRM